MKCIFKINESLMYEVEVPDTATYVVEIDNNLYFDFGDMRSGDSYRNLLELFRIIDNNLCSLCENVDLDEYAINFEHYKAYRDDLLEKRKALVNVKNYASLCSLLRGMCHVAIVMTNQVEMQIGSRK